MAALRVLVVFGGRSGEHEVSVASARTVLDALDKLGYSYRTVGITRSGRWVDADPRRCDAVAEDGQELEFSANLGAYPRSFYVAFPVLHGPFGEDGTIQGFFELAGVPFVGAGVEGSVIATNKVLHKRLFAVAGLPVVEFVAFTRGEWVDHAPEVAEAVAKLGVPCFAKPARLGSSVGISKIADPEQLDAAVARALQHDDLVLVEAAGGPAELEIGALEAEDGHIDLSVVGQIVPAGDFYDYESKYRDDDTDLVIPAPIDAGTEERIRGLARQAFAVASCEGMARIDFFHDPATGELLVNEINSIPGLTSSSMFPRVWRESGLATSAVVDRLLHHALARHERRTRLEAVRAASHAAEIRGGRSDR
jgi:D-alanine-D-alanine ligase